MSFCQFDGPPCLRHNNYVFYKCFEYTADGWSQTLALGDFFFLKILPEMSVCIGEIELLWEDQATSQLLASIKLYFQPEHTPNGRQDFTGEDEVIALGDRVVLRLDDLIPLIQHDVDWTYGCLSQWPVGQRSQETNGGLPGGLHTDSEECGWAPGNGTSKHGIVSRDQHGRKHSVYYDTSSMDCMHATDGTSGSANVAVLSYPKYCRYRAIRKRLEGCENQWLHLAVVIAIGGYTGRAPGCRVMFCRDTFCQSEIDDFSIGLGQMLPDMKARPRSKKNRHLSRKDSQQDSDSMEEAFANVTPSVPTSSRPRRSTEPSDIGEDKVSTEEQAFLIGLHKFMHDAMMPIGRIPSLGFKQIDLYFFYKQAEELGGYDSITHKRMWKYLYDKLGGHSSNTSAATCTRKHYERLLLPYERHLHRLKMGRTKKKQQKQTDRNAEVEAEIAEIKTDVAEVNPMKTVQEIENDTFHECSQSLNQTADCGGSNIQSEMKVEQEVPLLAEDDKMGSDMTSSESSLSEQKEGASVETVMPVRPEYCGEHVQKLEQHSKADLEQKSQVPELAAGRHRDLATRTAPLVPATDIHGGSNCQVSPVADCLPQKQQLVNASTGLAASLPSGALIVADSSSLPYTSVVYRGSYLLPVLPSHILQRPWGVTVQTSPSPSTSYPQMTTGETVCESAVKDTGETVCESAVRDTASSSLPSKISQDLDCQDTGLKSAIHRLSLSSQSCQLSASTRDVQNTEKANTSVKSSYKAPPSEHTTLTPSHFSPSEHTALKPLHFPLSEHTALKPPHFPPSEHTALKPSHFSSSEHTTLKPSHFPPSEHTALKPSHFSPSEHTALKPSHFPPNEHTALKPSHFLPSEYTALKPSHIPPSEHTALKPSHFPPSEHTEPAVKQHMPDVYSNELSANSSHSLAALLHPTPAGHRHLPHLPPAPPTVYLHPSPSSSSCLSIHSPVTATCPPPAHRYPRKRSCPPDNPALTAAVFPSPDIVLDRIRNSTALPRNSAVIAHPRLAPQRFEDPRQIFAQTAQSVTATHHISQSQKTEPHVQPELVASKLSSTKSKNSRKYHQAYAASNHVPSPELQPALLQQRHVEHRTSNNNKVVKKKPTAHFNGMTTSSGQTNKSGHVTPASPVPSASQDGRLTSALFGTQFTALPRTSKPGELTAVHNLMSDNSQAAVAAASLNAHLHPAFISAFLPSGSTSGTSTVNSQLQTLAGTYASASQLAAYEQMFAPNGYRAFLAAATQGKLSKKH